MQSLLVSCDKSSHKIQATGTQVLSGIISFFIASESVPSDAILWSLFKTLFDIGFRSQLTSSAIRRLAQGALAQVVSLIFLDSERLLRKCKMALAISLAALVLCLINTF